MHLTRWNYTKEEWKNFLHWKMRRKGLLFFFFQWFKTVKAGDVPEIRIATNGIWTNNTYQFFQNNRRRFRETHIRDAGRCYVLEIKFESKNKVCNIKIPIPKGKLREAFEIQERLVMENVSGG